jgi:hypothetical protein
MRLRKACPPRPGMTAARLPIILAGRVISHASALSPGQDAA